jgi:hypothetical protein
VQVDRPRADGAAAGQRDIRPAVTRQHRPQHQDRGTHGPDQFIRGDKIVDGGGIDLDIEFFIHDQFHPETPEQLHGSGDIVQMRHVAHGDRLTRQQGRRQDWQGGILGAGDTHFAVERTATGNNQFVHYYCALAQLSGVYVFRPKAWIAPDSTLPPKVA